MSDGYFLFKDEGGDIGLNAIVADRVYAVIPTAEDRRRKLGYYDTDWNFLHSLDVDVEKEWDEAKHPRDEGGKFGHGGGGGAVEVEVPTGLSPAELAAKGYTIFYHGTSAENVASIKKTGLREPKDGEGIYLSTNPLQAGRWAETKYGAENVVILKIDLKDSMDNIKGGSRGSWDNEYKHIGGIPGSAVVAVSSHKEGSPQKFEELGTGGASADYSSLRTMPKEIEGVSIIKKALPGGQLAIGGSSGIAVSTSRRAAAAWKDMAAYQKKAFESGWNSSAHPNHVIWHELAHVKVKTEGGVDQDSMLSNLRGMFNPHFKEMAAKVSKYAGTNGHEFVAEVFAAVRAGRKLDQDVLDYYKFLKGPKP